MVNQVRRIALASLLGIGMLAASVAPAHAVTITGKYNFTLGAVDVSFGVIDWTTDPGGITEPRPPVSLVKTYGTFDIDAGALRTGVFAGAEFSATPGTGVGGVLPNEPEKIMDLVDPGTYPGDANNVPVGASGGITNFFLIAEHPTWQFTETFLEPGVAPGIPFKITESGGQTSVTIVMHGFAVDTSDPFSQVTRWDAVISAQYTQSGAELEAILLGGGTLERNSWSGSFTASAVPEPATLLTFGVGALAAIRKRRKTAK